MENASKALLIAAAVLVVILLIAFGMKIFKSTSNASSRADLTGKQMTNTTEKAANTAKNALDGLGSWTN